MKFPENYTDTQKKRIERQIKIAEDKGLLLTISRDGTRIIWKNGKTGQEVLNESAENYK